MADYSNKISLAYGEKRIIHIVLKRNVELVPARTGTGEDLSANIAENKAKQKSSPHQWSSRNSLVIPWYYLFLETTPPAKHGTK